jgi:hypothetical protein
MQEKARVIAIDGDVISVIPLEIEACINCNNTACKQNGNVFFVVNSRKFDIRVGSEVRVASPAKKQAGQAISAIGVPVACAALAGFAVTRIFPSAGEGLAIGCGLLTLVLAAALMTFLLRRSAKDLPEIVEVF